MTWITGRIARCQGILRTRTIQYIPHVTCTCSVTEVAHGHALTIHRRITIGPRLVVKLVDALPCTLVGPIHEGRRVDEIIDSVVVRIGRVTNETPEIIEILRCWRAFACRALVVLITYSIRRLRTCVLQELLFLIVCESTSGCTSATLFTRPADTIIVVTWVALPATAAIKIESTTSRDEVSVVR